MSSLSLNTPRLVDIILLPFSINSTLIQSTSLTSTLIFPIKNYYKPNRVSIMDPQTNRRILRSRGKIGRFYTTMLAPPTPRLNLPTVSQGVHNGHLKFQTFTPDSFHPALFYILQEKREMDYFQEFQIDWPPLLLLVPERLFVAVLSPRFFLA